MSSDLLVLICGKNCNSDRRRTHYDRTMARVNATPELKRLKNVEKLFGNPLRMVVQILGERASQEARSGSIFGD